MRTDVLWTFALLIMGGVIGYHLGKSDGLTEGTNIMLGKGSSSS